MAVFGRYRGEIMENDKCKGCPYWGVVDVDENENLIWACTRINCIERELVEQVFPELDKASSSSSI